MRTFVVTFPDLSDTARMDSFQEMMDAVHDATNVEIQGIASEHNITIGAASNIWYLRTRSRWTQEKENYLIWLDQHDQDSPSIMENFEVPSGYQYTLMTVREACDAALLKLGVATRPMIAQETGKNIRRINAVFLEDYELPVHQRKYRLVDGYLGKGSHMVPAQFAFADDTRYTG